MEAPERICLTIDDGAVFLEGEYPYPPIFCPKVWYIRADHRLSPETVERIRKADAMYIELLERTPVDELTGVILKEYVPVMFALNRDILMEVEP